LLIAQNLSSNKNIAIVEALDVDINASKMVDSVVPGTVFANNSSRKNAGDEPRPESGVPLKQHNT
jgi:hypothetical protein